jgi:TP901 family phage tail tape measure protein
MEKDLGFDGIKQDIKDIITDVVRDGFAEGARQGVEQGAKEMEREFANARIQSSMDKAGKKTASSINKVGDNVAKAYESAITKIQKLTFKAERKGELVSFSQFGNDPEQESKAIKRRIKNLEASINQYKALILDTQKEMKNFKISDVSYSDLYNDDDFNASEIEKRTNSIVKSLETQGLKVGKELRNQIKEREKLIDSFNKKKKNISFDVFATQKTNENNITKANEVFQIGKVAKALEYDILKQTGGIKLDNLIDFDESSFSVQFNDFVDNLISDSSLDKVFKQKAQNILDIYEYVENEISKQKKTSDVIKLDVKGFKESKNQVHDLTQSIEDAEKKLSKNGKLSRGVKEQIRRLNSNKPDEKSHNLKNISAFALEIANAHKHELNLKELGLYEGSDALEYFNKLLKENLLIQQAVSKISPDLIPENVISTQNSDLSSNKNRNKNKDDNGNGNANVNFKEINSKLEEVESRTKEVLKNISQEIANVVSQDQNEEYYKGRLDALENLETELEKIKELSKGITIPEDHDTFLRKNEENETLIGNVDTLIAQQKESIHKVYDSIDFEAKRAQEESARRIAERQSSIIQKITGNEDFSKYGEANWLQEYINRVKDSTDEIDSVYAEFEQRLKQRKAEILAQEAKEEQINEQKSKVISFLRGMSPTGSEEFASNLEKYADILNLVEKEGLEAEEVIRRIQNAMNGTGGTTSPTTPLTNTFSDEDLEKSCDIIRNYFLSIGKSAEQAEKEVEIFKDKLKFEEWNVGDLKGDMPLEWIKAYTSAFENLGITIQRVVKNNGLVEYGIFKDLDMSRVASVDNARKYLDEKATIPDSTIQIVENQILNNGTNQVCTLEQVNAELEKEEENYRKISQTIDDWNDRYSEFIKKREKYENGLKNEGDLYDKDKVLATYGLGTSIKESEVYQKNNIKKSDMKVLYNDVLKMLDNFFAKYSAGEYLSNYKDTEDFIANFNNMRWLKEMVDGKNAYGDKVTYSGKEAKQNLKEVMSYVSGIMSSISKEKVMSSSFIPLENDEEYKELQRQREENDKAYRESMVHKEALREEQRKINVKKQEELDLARKQNIEEKKSSASTPLPFTEESSGQLSFLETANKTSDLIEEQTGQMAMFETASKEATDTAIEGQMKLGDYIDENVKGQRSLNDLLNEQQPLEEKKRKIRIVAYKDISKLPEGIKINRQEAEASSSATEEIVENKKEETQARRENVEAAREEAKATEDTVKLSEEVLEKIKAIQEKGKIIGTSETNSTNRTRTYQDEIGRTYTIGEQFNKDEDDWIPTYYRELTSYTKLEKEAITITNKLADAYANMDKAKRTGATTAEIEEHQKLIDLLEEEETLIKKQASDYFKEQGLGEDYTEQVFDERVSKETDKYAVQRQIKTLNEIRKENEANLKIKEKEKKTIEQSNSFLERQKRVLSNMRQLYDKDVNPYADKYITDTTDVAGLTDLRTRYNDILSQINNLMGTKVSQATRDSLLNQINDFENQRKSYTKMLWGATDLTPQELGISKDILKNNFDAFIVDAQIAGQHTTDLIEKVRVFASTIDTIGSSEGVKHAKDQLSEYRTELRLLNKEEKFKQDVEKTNNAEYKANIQVIKKYADAHTELNRLYVQEEKQGNLHELTAKITEQKAKVLELKQAAKDAAMEILHMFQAGSISEQQKTDAISITRNVSVGKTSSDIILQAVKKDKQDKKKEKENTARTKWKDKAYEFKEELKQALQIYSYATEETKEKANNLLEQLKRPTFGEYDGIIFGHVDDSNVNNVIKKIKSDADTIIKELKIQHEKAEKTAYSGQTKEYEQLLNEQLKDISFEDAVFKNSKVDSAGKTVLTFVEVLGDKVRETKVYIDDANEALDRLTKANKKSDELYSYRTNSSYRNARMSDYDGVDESSYVQSVIQAYRELSKTEKQYQDLRASVDNGIATDKQVKDYKILCALRERYNGIIEKQIVLDKEEQIYYDKVGKSKIDKEKSKYETRKGIAQVAYEENDKVIKERINSSEVKNALASTEQLMNQLATKNLDGFGAIFDSAKKDVEELNVALKAGNLDTDAYTEKVQKIANGLNNVVAVLPSGLDDVEGELKKIANSLPNAEIGQFDEINKTLKVTLDKGKGTIQEVTLEYDQLNGAVSKSKSVTKQAETSWASFFKSLKKRAQSLVQYLMTFASFYEVFSWIRQGVSVIRELDTALTEMRKVSDETSQSLKNFQKVSFDIANNIGTTAAQIQNSASDFMRLGYSLQEAAELAKDANIYANVGDMEIEEATEHMISSIKAWESEFSSEVEASAAIVDRYNEIGNNFAISSADIGSAMERSAAALKAGGNTLNESLGLITAGNIIQQDAETTAAALKILSLRIRGSKADLEEMGESTDGLITSTSKLREQIKGLTGVDIMLDENTYKSTAQIIQELGAVYNQLTDIQQANLLELIAGEQFCLKFVETHFYRTHLIARTA